MEHNQRQAEHRGTLKFLDRIFKIDDVVYISGPMSGIPDMNRKVFRAVKRMIAEASGATVLSPADLKQGFPWEHQMRLCIRYISDATKIVMLPGWQDSRGALIEHLVASQLLVPRWYLDDSLLRAAEVPSFELGLAHMTRFMEERLAHNTAEDSSND